ncbi:hypothetical protein CEUSTIGMA_g916.t1 [Chlamydomonas eustigma]|uniref:UspA domain-containing protein n=1 Tax=Chlamydomonas eustigma TaxID=1157962 RepID=A0A250WRJ0_9CHLO|nr:hypothetical protein CEUSTIGMA_g916.t1 [Chlamydomonas eustigma]|eukprot:GAX73464.1 hypothetical protein CEUSTIGMA_g916.t1 [Chlamydomonas eustigma]
MGSKALREELEKLDLDAELLDDFDEDPEHSAQAQKVVAKHVTALAYVNNTPLCRQALHLVKALLNGRCSQITIAHCAVNQYAHEGMIGVLETMVDPLAGLNVKTELFTKGEDQTLLEAMKQYVELTKPDLVIIASKGLCNDEPVVVTPGRPKVKDTKQGLKPARSAFGLKICQTLRTVPLLVYKANTRGAFFTMADPAVSPMRCVVDLQPTSRHMLVWIMNLLHSEKDQMSLSVCKAYEGGGAVIKQTASRMMTAFAVQTSVNKFKTQRRFFKEAPEKALPQYVFDEQIDVLMIQGPRTKDLSPLVVDLLVNTPTSILIWPPDAEDTALGQAPKPKAEDTDASHALAQSRSISLDGGPVSSKSQAGGAISMSTNVSRRTSNSSGTGYRYGYGPTDAQVDPVTQAALEAAAARMAKRKEENTKATAGSAGLPPRRPGAL